jgi:hypothetical protein
MGGCTMLARCSSGIAQTRAGAPRRTAARVGCVMQPYMFCTYVLLRLCTGSDIYVQAHWSPIVLGAIQP